MYITFSVYNIYICIFNIYIYIYNIYIYILYTLNVIYIAVLFFYLSLVFYFLFLSLLSVSLSIYTVYIYINFYNIHVIKCCNARCSAIGHYNGSPEAIPPWTRYQKSIVGDRKGIRPYNQKPKPNQTFSLSSSLSVIKSKRHRTWQKIHEPIMDMYLQLCVELKKSHIAKEGLHRSG